MKTKVDSKKRGCPGRAKLLMLIAGGLCCGVCAKAAFLSDAELYFDPDSISDDFYSRIYLPDLSVQNSYMWTFGSDNITDADILPVLKPGTYYPGYSFSQSDYYQTPNTDYLADLTGGQLTGTFTTPGLYHVRLTLESGNSQIYAVFAESGLKEKVTPDKTGVVKKLDPVPAADLVVVERSDNTLDDSALVWQNAGRTVVRVANRAEVVTAISNRYVQLGRKIHVEIDGHGAPGNISTGAGTNNIADKQIDLASVSDFQEEIDQFVSEITFQGCSVGKGAEGKQFLDILARSLGKGNSGAWDSPVTVVDQSYFTVERYANWITGVPEPSTLVLAGFGAGLLLVAWRRRAVRH